jgi:hypothetical protein
MSRNFVLATAVLAVVGWGVATGPASAEYVNSGMKEFGNAPGKVLSPEDARAIFNGEARLVSGREFAKFLAKHPDYQFLVAPVRQHVEPSGAEAVHVNKTPRR